MPLGRPVVPAVYGFIAPSRPSSASGGRAAIARSSGSWPGSSPSIDRRRRRRLVRSTSAGCSVTALEPNRTCAPQSLTMYAASSTFSDRLTVVQCSPDS